MALPADKKSIAVTVTKDMHEKLKEKADKERRSVSFIANEYIKKGLEKECNN